MNIAEMRMLGRKINEQNVAKAKAQVEVAPVSVSSNVPVVAPIVKTEEDPGWGKYVVVPEVKPVSVREAVSSSYVIIDEVSEPIVEVVVPEVKKDKKARRSVGSILGRIVNKKEVAAEAPVVDVPAEQEVNVPQLTRDELIKSVEAALAKQEVIPSRIMKCNGCKDDFKVTPEDDMFKTGRCPACTEVIEPVRTESAYGMTAVALHPSVTVKKKNGLRAGGKKTSTADLGLDLSEAQ